MLHIELKNKNIVLASASPRRADILKRVGINFVQIPANVNEDICQSDYLNPRKYVRNLAEVKCETIKNKFSNDCIVVAADTTVYINKTILGKPQDRIEAFNYLKLLSNQTHTVYTGLAISYKDCIISEIAKSSVKFYELSDNEIKNYIETKEPLDKAGAYGIQGFGSQFIESIKGCYFNVMGFPISLFYKMIHRVLSSES